MKKFKISGFAVPVAAVGTACMLVACPECCVKGAVSGLITCASVVIPSLFPFLIVSSFVALSPSCGRAMRVFSPVMRHIFRLPACAAPAVIFGFFGGYPVGCSVAAQFFRCGLIDAEQAQRITCFCVNAGPAFVITAVGTVMLGNIRAGVILFLSVLISGILLGFALGLTAPKPQKQTENEATSLTNSQALVESVENGAVAMMKICAWTVVFSCVSGMLSHWNLGADVLTALNCVLEVTAGCTLASENANLCTLAAALGWGGLCVGLQVLGNVKSVGTRPTVFFAFRAVNAGLSAVICGVITRLFPLEASVFSNVAAVSARQFSYSLPATAALICLCTVFIIDLDRNRKVC
ncbi:MAG: hypothetical protein IJN38_06725 [Clostridia bacterium]|nr:hypothetical protein [Clostridia bacterium]